MTLYLAFDVDSLPPWIQNLARTAIIAVVLIGLLVTFAKGKSKGKDDD